MSFGARAERHRAALAPARRVRARCAPCLLAVALGAGYAQAQVVDHVVVKGLQDLELFQTDSNSRLLSRNDGELAGAGRLRLWAAAEFTSGFQGVLLGRLEGGKANDESGTRGEIEQAFLRYVSPGRTHLMVDAGRVVFPIGNFSKRYLSSVNPLIGAPDSYDVAYPEGVVVTGAASFFDYRIAVIDRPLANKEYVPEGDTSWRPAADLGFTPVIGLRLGAYVTQGPYLGRAVEPMLAAGEPWRDFDQRVAGLELEFSRGHFELNGDWAFSTYEVPTRATLSRGQAWFFEPKYTFTPRLFAAMRVEKNDYPYIRPIDSTLWIAQNVTFHDVEAGLGWRFTPELVLKASYRRDEWNVSDSMKSFFPNGYSCGLQLSYGFDVKSWFEPRR
jgi:hypothetical protein